MKKIIKLTEAKLHAIVRESVNRVLKEMSPEVYHSYSNGRLQQARDARANGDYNKEMQLRSKAAQGGAAWGQAMRKKHGFDSIDDFNQTAQRASNGMTLPQNNPKYQNYQNYQQDAERFFQQ